MPTNPKDPARVKSRRRLFILFALLITALSGGAFTYLFLATAPLSPPRPTAPQPAAPRLEQAAPPSLPPAALSQEPAQARLAIIIDDIGNSKATAVKLMALELPLSFSILPHRPYSKTLARRAEELGKDVLLHLPMEPVDQQWNAAPDRGTLFLSMPEEAIAATLIDDVLAIPRIIGINNHMGSKFTESRQAMTFLLAAIRSLPPELQQPEPLFFIDSLTSAKSVGYQLAREMNIKTARRNVFLDNDRVPSQILQQLRRLVSSAKRNGQAIGIGHPYPETFEVLRDAQAYLKQEVQLVPVHELIQ